MPKKKAQPQKRGAKGHYTGTRLTFLTSYCDEYIALRGKSRNDFWFRLFTEWWGRYPWRLPDDQEPPTGNSKKMEELGLVGADETLKGMVEEESRTRIKSWFSYRASSHHASHEGVWSPMLKRIHQNSNPKPRCRTIFQQFMHEEPEILNSAFRSAYGEGKMDRAERLNKWNELAKSLVTTDYKHLVADLQSRAKEAHELELREWGLGLADVGEAENVHLARDSLFSAVHPLLKLIGCYTGCYVTLVAAAPGDDKPYFSTVHYFPQDKAKRVNWTDYDKKDFNSGVVGPFLKYINWMEDSENKQSGSAPSKAESTPTVQFPPTIPPKTIPPTVVTASQQPVGSKKRALVYIEDNSEDDDDVDMDNIEDNDSSGSSVESDHVPAKRLRTSIATRSSRTTPAFEGSTTGVNVHRGSSPAASDHSASDHVPAIRLRASVATHSSRTTPAFEGSTANVNSHRGSSSTVGDHPARLGNHNAEPEPEPEPEPEIPSADPGADANVLSPSVSITPTNDAAPGATPTPSHLCPSSMDTDKPSAVPKVHSAPRVSVRHVRKPVMIPTIPQVTPSQLPSPGHRLEIPDFLKGKNNIYAYLSRIKDAGFRDLLKGYIKFELAHPSRRGNLPTARRPSAVTWWSSRARPNKIPLYDSLKSFQNSIVEWWIFIQPDWRKIREGEVSRVGGDWERIHQPGINGLLNVIILAYWWARILEERDSPVDDRYSWFVADVKWVLSQLSSDAYEGL